MLAWRRMFQTLRVSPSVQSPPWLRRKLFGGLVSQTRTPPECGNPKGGRAGSREPSPKGLGGLHQQKHPGRSACSSRKVRHEMRVSVGLLAVAGRAALEATYRWAAP